MRRILPTWLLAAALAGGLGAQVAPEAGPAKTAYEQLLADYEAANQAYRTALDELRASEAYQKAVAAEDRDAQRELLSGVERVDRAAMAQQAMELAAQFTGDDQIPFYTWAIVYGGDKDVTTAAIAAVRRDHLKSDALTQLLERGSLIGRALGAEAGDAFLDAVIEQSPHALPRAWAMYWKAYPTTRARDASEEDKAAAMAVLEQAAKLAEGTDLADRIAAPMFEQERLQIGMVAPDIEGVDTDGTPFKLSDYRGKVVVLDFWGFW